MNGSASVLNITGNLSDYTRVESIRDTGDLLLCMPFNLVSACIYLYMVPSKPHDRAGTNSAVCHPRNCWWYLSISFSIQLNTSF